MRPKRADGARLSVTAALLIAWIVVPVVTRAQAPIIQPGAPGEPARALTAEEATRIAVTRYSPDDVRFMQDMIPHHHQALRMADLVRGRTNTPELLDVAGRIEVSQKEEIAFMQRWLRERGERVPDPAAHAAMYTDRAMAGMATPEQMADLAAAEGVAFDRLFLELMIAHHAGAVKMVEALHEKSGSAYDPALYEFTTEITNDQTAEIERMHALLIDLSADPRAGLAAGYQDAEQASWNMRLVAALPRPPGFFDPSNPGEVPAEALPRGKDEETEDDEEENRRLPLLSFANTDLAFAGDLLAVGSYHGFMLYRLADDGVPVLLSSVVCPGGQGDVSIIGDLLLMSVEQTRARLDCGLQGVSEDVSPERFRGLRIFDISDVRRPVQVGAVQTCRGSHTHSIVSGPDEAGLILVYNSGTAKIRDAEELPGCIDETPGDARTALFRIDVIEIPVDDPGAARITASPAVFADPADGVLAGLWRGGDHGAGTQETSKTDHCHDITVFPDKNIAAGACSGNGILFDISDPLHPKRLDAVVDKGFAYWHSATFNNDGTKVIFTDEWGGGDLAYCRAHDPLDWGANAIYDIVDGKLEFRSYYKLPAPQTEQENCVAHNGSIVPVPGRDIFVQAWYQGGVSLIDFTDSANPVEIGFFDRGPLDAGHLIFAGYWSTYWYRGRIYGTESVRGLDVLALTPSEYLSEHEIAAAESADYRGAFNPQQQFRVRWPAEPVVAMVYLDRLVRGAVIDDALAADITAALEQASRTLASRESDYALGVRLELLARDLVNPAEEGAIREGRAGLAISLKNIAERFR
ncbi:MAG: DUF305 domain-containing protein [Woeseiaceae bacterium]|nr:DUF305 domain-containing protein [Woeseiaceae bacterium]